jgi:hypothetical protein
MIDFSDDFCREWCNLARALSLSTNGPMPTPQPNTDLTQPDMESRYELPV